MTPPRWNSRFKSPTLLKKGIYPLLLAFFFTTVFANCVYSGFVKQRIKVLDTRLEPDGGLASVRFRARGNIRNELRILTVKAVNSTDQIQNITLYFNGIELGKMTLAPEKKSRFSWDLPSPDYLKAKNMLQLHSDATGWVVEEIQLGNVYGFSNHLLHFVILNQHFSTFESPNYAVSFLLLSALCFLGFFVPGLRSSPLLRWTYLPILGLILMLMAGVLLLPAFSKFKLVFTVRTFLWLVFFSYLPALVNGYRIGLRTAERHDPRTRTILKSSFTILGISLFFLCSMLETLKGFGGNYTGFLHFSQKRFNRVPFSQELDKNLLTSPQGYDGQFFYLMSFDPFLNRYRHNPEEYRNIVDAPPLRYRRIGFSWLTKVFSLDQPTLYPQTMVYLILFSYALGALFLIKIALLHGKSPFWAAFSILIPAFTISLKTALPEPISTALLLGGVYFYLKERIPLSSLLFAAALLVRETGMLLLAVLVLQEFFQKKNRKGAIVLALAGLPHILWRLFLTWRLFGDYGWTGLYYEPDNISLPFQGIVNLFLAIHQGVNEPGVVPAGLTFPIVLCFLLGLSLLALRVQKDFLAWSLFAYSLLAISLNFHKVWNQPVNVERQSFESFVCLLLVFLTRKESLSSMRFLFLLFFSVLFLYDWVFLTEWYSFRSGFMLKPIMRFIFTDV